MIVTINLADSLMSPEICHTHVVEIQTDFPSNFPFPFATLSRVIMTDSVTPADWNIKSAHNCT
jgi:hypothetical protein